MYLFLI